MAYELLMQIQVHEICNALALRNESHSSSLPKQLRSLSFTQTAPQLQEGNHK